MMVEGRWLLLLCCTLAIGELLQNGDFESLSSWRCWSPIHCSLTADSHSGQHAVLVTGRQEQWQGPTQYIPVQPDHVYSVSGYVKLVNDMHNGQHVQMELDYHFTDDTHRYAAAATRSRVRVSDGWVYLSGIFTAPDKALQETRIYFQGPSPGVDFMVDNASVVEVGRRAGWRNATDRVIDRIRKSDIHIQVTTAASIDKAEVEIHVLQKTKSFPFGTAINCQKYNDNVAGGKYQDFIHQHFNLAVPGNALKWYAIEPRQGHRVYQRALDAIHTLHRHGLKVRGHTLIWAVEKFVQGWVKQLNGSELRDAVTRHIQETLNVTRGLLENWDVNNEHLHGDWYEQRLQDPDFNTEMFRIAHNADPTMKLFLNDYNVVARGDTTDAYLAQAQQLKTQNVGLYGMGVQTHFGEEVEPDPNVMKHRLDKLAQAGLPIWVTELDVQAVDENTRADYLEKALRAVYGHPAVEAILIWGFWDQSHWRGEKASLTRGDNMELTAAGRRFLDLLENQWMTDETHDLAQSGDSFTVRGFHGDYEVSVIYQGQVLESLNETFTLATAPQTISLNVHL